MQPTNKDNNINALSIMHDWIQSIANDLALNLDSTLEIQPLMGDASIRKYYLLTNNHNAHNNYLNNTASNMQLISHKFIIMQTPNNKSLYNFIKIADFLTKLNLPINIPKILAIKKYNSLRFLLLSHLGDQLIFNHLDINNVELIYSLALKKLTDLQLNSINIDLASMDRKYIKKNLNLFKNWYLKIHLKSSKVNNLNKLLTNLENYFVKVFTSQPQVFTHVDYHSKNLMLEPNKQLTMEQNLGILDFQDAMFGPITYDIASLLQDAYIIWPEKLIEAIVFKHYDYLINQNNKFNLSNTLSNNLSKNLSKDQFLKYFYLTGLQRHIKNLGIFARLKYFYNKPNYIQYIQNLLHYINQTCNKYNDPELISLKNLLQNIDCSNYSNSIKEYQS